MLKTKLSLGLAAGTMLFVAVTGLNGCGPPKDPAIAFMEEQANKPPPAKDDAESGLQVDMKGFVPGPAPDVHFKTLDGKDAKLSDYRGKVVLIDLWATWCGPCKKGLPFTDRMSRELKDRGLQVLAISDEPGHVIKAFVNEYKYAFDAFSDESDDAVKAFMSPGFPTTIIVDRKGNVVSKEIGLSPQAETIESLKKAGLDVSGFEPKDDPTAS